MGGRAALERSGRPARAQSGRGARARGGPHRGHRRPAPVCTEPQHLPQQPRGTSRTPHSRAKLLHFRSAHPLSALLRACHTFLQPHLCSRTSAASAPPHLCSLCSHCTSAGFSGLAPLEWLSADTPLPGWGAGRPGSAGSAGGQSNGSRASRLSRGSGDSAASSARTEHAALRSSASARSRCSISEAASTSDSRGTKGAFAVYLLAQSERVRAVAP